MGCSNVTEEEKIISKKRKLETIINENESNLKQKDAEVTKLDMKIVQLESDIVQNQFILSEIELKNKARIIAELKKDKIRKDKERNNLNILNETMKNNLQMMELKIEEYRNAKSIEEANSLLKDIYNMNFSKSYKNNVKSLLQNKQQNEENMRVLEDGNKLYLNDNNNKVESPDDILNNLIKREPATTNMVRKPY